MSGADSVQLRCEEALRMLAEFLDHELDETANERVTAHLDTCRSCYSRAEFERRLKHKLRELAAEPVDAAFETRIRELMRTYVRPAIVADEPEGGPSWS